MVSQASHLASRRVLEFQPEGFGKVFLLDCDIYGELDIDDSIKALKKRVVGRQEESGPCGMPPCCQLRFKTEIKHLAFYTGR